MTEEQSTHRLAWTCEVCRFPIADHAGSIFIPYEDIRSIGRREEHSAEWIVAHFRCDDRDGYAIDVERIRTHKQALAWTAHLMGKNWSSWTDWCDVIEDQVGVTL